MGDVGMLMEDHFLSLSSYVADQERQKFLKRQAEGVAEAKKQGKHLGRPQLNINTISKQQRETLDQKYQSYKSKTISGVQFAEMLDLKKNGFYKIIKEYEAAL